jgi:hypothetical protein
MVQATPELVAEWITSESEYLEIITDLINGEYTQEALRQDFEESMEDHALSWLQETEREEDMDTMLDLLKE